MLNYVEGQTGVRVSIRGRGSAADGDNAEEDLHVLIESSPQANEERAIQILDDLFTKPERRDDIITASRVSSAPSRPQIHEERKEALALDTSLYAESAITGESAASFFGKAPVQDGAESKSMTVPNDTVGLVIGRGGETIKMIQGVSGANVQVSQEPDVNHNRSITITGNPGQIDRAEYEIQRVIENKQRERQQGAPTGGLPMGGPDGEGTVITIPNDCVGALIGRGGETIKSLQLRTGCQVQVTKDSDAAPGATERAISLFGNPQVIEAARREIENLVSASRLGADGSNAPVTVIKVPNDCVGLIIGRGGESIRGIQMRTGARVQMDRQVTGPERDVTLSGQPHQIEAAKREIDQIVQNNQMRRQGGGGGGYGATPSYGGGYGNYQQQPMYHQQQQQPQYGAGAYYQQQQPQAQAAQPQAAAASGASSGGQGYEDYYNYYAAYYPAEQAAQYAQYYFAQAQAAAGGAAPATTPTNAGAPSGQ